MICDMLDSFNTTIESSGSSINTAEVDATLLKDKIDELFRHNKSLRNQLNTIEGQTKADNSRSVDRMKSSEPGIYTNNRRSNLNYS